MQWTVVVPQLNYTVSASIVSNTEKDSVSASVTSNVDADNAVSENSQESQSTQATFVKLYVNSIDVDVLKSATQGTKTAITNVEPSIKSIKSVHTYTHYTYYV